MPQVISQALALHEQGRLDEAERLYRQALRQQPRDYAALHLLGTLKLQQDRPLEAAQLIAAALEVDPRSSAAHSNYGLALSALERYEEAIASFDQAIEIDPRNCDGWSNRGDALCDLGRADEALASYDRALALEPKLVVALVNRGLLLRELGRVEEAIASYDRALAVDSRNAEAHNNRGVALQDLGRHREAIASYERAVATRPDYVEALFNRGNALLLLKRPGEALASYDKALLLRPNFAEALCNRGHALADMRRFEEALAGYIKAIAARPDYLEALTHRAVMLGKLDRHDEAIAEFERLLVRHPDAWTLKKELLGCASAVCDWDRTERLAPELITAAIEGKTAVDPFMLLGYDASAASHLEIAKTWLRVPKIVGHLRDWDAQSYASDRLRVAYLSADFHRHATAHLMAELLELHDRRHFEIIGISFGLDDRSALRSRVVKAFDRFFDVRTRSDVEAASLVRDLKAHIAVDLKGYTTDARPGILAHRAAPLQVSYLGYPCTTGADFIDYVIADPVVLPFDQASFYTEKIVHLPDSYQVNDRGRAVAQRPTRTEVGLPDRAFVFSCFNNNWKFNRPMFSVWMRLLAAVDGSVLWLFQLHAAAAGHLRREAAAQGIDPDRLVFASQIDMPEHMARVGLADLFLDTLPYNAHTTASDSLWMGVPVVTCVGSTFAGRVAASLLHTAGLPELVTQTLQEYEDLALSLATDAARLRAVRERLGARRASCALFDTDRFRRHIEAAYTAMWDRWRRGESPRQFAVAPIEMHGAEAAPA